MSKSNTQCTIFYSWQSDNKAVKNFIQRSLESLNGIDYGLDIAIDHDTYGLPGSPKIEDAIIKKIKNCDLFVADVTIINQDYNGRKVCNPNVLVELGVAISSLGWDRIVLLNCSDFGTVNDLPFDFNHHRTLSFSLADNKRESSRKQIKNRITISLQQLLSKGLLHGGNPESVAIKKHLYTNILRALSNALNNRPVIVSNSELDSLILLEGIISDDDFNALHKLLSAIINISISDEGSAYCITSLIEECIDPLYLSYISSLPMLNIMDILQERYYNLLNSLRPTSHQSPFAHRRILDDNVVFSSDPQKLAVYSSDRTLLLEGKLNENGLFCGFQIMMEQVGLYIGNFENGLRSGYGTIFCENKRGEGFKYPLCCGIWEQDELKEGMIFSVCSYNYWLDEIKEKGAPSEDFYRIGSIFNGCIPDIEEGKCPVYDVIVKNGIGCVIPDTLQYYPEEVFSDSKELEKIYLERMSRYKYELNQLSINSSGYALNYDFRIRKYNIF